MIPANYPAASAQTPVLIYSADPRQMNSGFGVMGLQILQDGTFLVEPTDKFVHTICRYDPRDPTAKLVPLFETPEAGSYDFKYDPSTDVLYVDYELTRHQAIPQMSQILTREQFATALLIAPSIEGPAPDLSSPLQLNGSVLTIQLPTQATIMAYSYYRSWVAVLSFHILTQYRLDWYQVTD